MKKFFSKVKGFGTAIVLRAKMAVRTAQMALFRTKAVFACNRGEGFIDTAVKILISVVLGALLLAGLYLLFSGTVLPTLTQKITDMFNYSN